MRVLVTGGKGFVGLHLVDQLVDRGHEVLSTSRSAGGGGTTRLDLPDEARCYEILVEFRPDAVIHLAGISFVPEAEGNRIKAIEVNVQGTLDVLGALRRADPRALTRLVHISTGQIYDLRTGGPLGEDAPLLPRNTYARSKLAAELAVEACARGEGRPGVIFRPFNHAGPGQRQCFVISNFARQVARIERGTVDPILLTGSLHAQRDFCDVRDVARAYVLAAEGSVAPGTYNIASGISVPLASVVEILQALARTPFEVRVDESLLREGDERHPAGDARRMRNVSGWEPSFTLETSVLDTLEWWRNVDGD